MPERSGSTSVSPKLERIAKLAKQMPNAALSTLAHHIDIDWLHEAYRRTRKDAAVGVDGQTAADYEVNLEENLRSLLDRAKSGDHYRAPPVRRVHVPKDGQHKIRPSGLRRRSEGDPILAPPRLLGADAADESDVLGGDAGPAGLAGTPAPIPPESASVPVDHRCRFDEGQR